MLRGYVRVQPPRESCIWYLPDWARCWHEYPQGARGAPDHARESQSSRSHSATLECFQARNGEPGSPSFLMESYRLRDSSDVQSAVQSVLRAMECLLDVHEGKARG